jgi:hypothetical protein
LGAIVNPIILDAEGKIDLRVRISGVGFSLPGTAADVNPIFNMLDKLADCTGKKNTCN